MRRRRVALSLAILWIVGFELLPWAHIALHDHLAHHHHDENGADVLDEKPAGHDDDHDSAVDEHGVPIALHDHGDDDDDDDDHAPLTAGEHQLLEALAHAGHSLAHHGIAVPVPAPAMTAPLPVDRQPIAIEEVAVPAWVSAAVPLASARGPPAFLV
ncbi:MAG: hypothetical protein JO257_36020 [Deltaproteobacteria bacterium]|nr:hypothetical protein [Deltaproteobacteria bacterium]